MRISSEASFLTVEKVSFDILFIAKILPETSETKVICLVEKKLARTSLL